MIAVFVTALAVSSVGMLLVLPILRRAQVMDIPNARSSHISPTPRGGGIAVVAAIVAAAWFAKLQGQALDPWILGAILVFAGLGFLDDVFGLGVPVRLGCQLMTAVIVTTHLLGDGSVSGTMSLVVGSIWLVGYTNAYNFMDGVNGISALSAALAGGWYALLGVSASDDVLSVLGLAIAGASLGFLPWNAPKAKVFLGDVGSYALGFSVGAVALLAWARGFNLTLSVAPLVIYLGDTAWTLVRRLVAGSPWHKAHREHVYQRLTERGWSHLASALTVASFASLACLAALALGNSAPLFTFFLFMPIVIAYLSLPRFLVPVRSGSIREGLR